MLRVLEEFGAYERAAKGAKAPPEHPNPRRAAGSDGSQNP
jgi:hypothetical protein